MNKDPILLWVSPNGNDNASGTADCPLRTVQGAKSLLRQLDTTNGAQVNFYPGEYQIEGTCTFLQEDGGSPDFPIIYKANGNVRLIGGYRLSHELFCEPECDIARRFECPEKVLCIDLSSLPLDPETTVGVMEGTPRFYAGDGFYEAARFPNREKRDAVCGPFLYSQRTVVSTGEDQSRENDVVLYYDGEQIKTRMSRWDEQSIRDAVVYGFLWQPYCYERYKVYDYDAQNGILRADVRTHRWERPYSIKGDTVRDNKRSFIQNVPEELDEQGELFYCRSSKKLYFIPYPDFAQDTPMYISTLTEPILSFDGAQNIAFEGFDIMYCASEAISVNNSRGITFDSCRIAHTSLRAASIVNSTYCRFLSCDIFDLAEGGLYFISCGSCYELEHSHNEVVNCVITNATRIQAVYNPHIEITDCCGILIAGNTLTKSQHQLLLMTRVNDITIENNVFSQALLDTDDAAAIYWVGYPANLGIVIRNNYFENMGNENATFLQGAIYIDDWTTGADIYDNVFYNCSQLSRNRMDCHTNANAIVLNNGQFMSAHNNIMIHTYDDQKPVNLYGCPSYIIWMSFVYGLSKTPYAGESWHDKLKKAGFFTERWREHYKNTIWASMWDYATEQAYAELEEYRQAHADEPWEKVRVDLLWRIFDDAWDHYTEYGEYYPGSFREYYTEHYSKELEGELDVIGRNDPAWGTAVSDHIFWKLVYHKLFVRTTNVFRNNLSVGMDRAYLDENGKLKGNVMNGFDQNYLPYTDKLEDGTSMFVDTEARNFELSAQGIKAVHKHLPEFHNVTLKNVGAKR